MVIVVVLLVEVVIVVSSGIISNSTSGSISGSRIIGKNVISEAIWNIIRRMMKREKQVETWDITG